MPPDQCGGGGGGEEKQVFLTFLCSSPSFPRKNIES